MQRRVERKEAAQIHFGGMCRGMHSLSSEGGLFDYNSKLPCGFRGHPRSGLISQPPTGGLDDTTLCLCNNVTRQQSERGRAFCPLRKKIERTAAMTTTVRRTPIHRPKRTRQAHEMVASLPQRPSEGVTSKGWGISTGNLRQDRDYRTSPPRKTYTTHAVQDRRGVHTYYTRTPRLPFFWKKESMMSAWDRRITQRLTNRARTRG